MQCASCAKTSAGRSKSSARKVGTSRQAIIAIENGRFDPSLPLAIKLSRILNKPIEEIFFLDE